LYTYTGSSKDTSAPQTSIKLKKSKRLQAIKRKYDVSYSTSGIYQ